MKNSLLIFLVAIVQVSASVSIHGQNLTLMSEGNTVREIFKQIENETNYRFFYNEEFRDLSQPLSFEMRDYNINEVLDLMLANSDVTYRIMENNVVVITPKLIDNQGITVTGSVTEASTGEPIPGVSVVIRGTSIGTVTNASGNYSLSNIPDDAILVFSFVGMESQQIVVGDQRVIDVTMREDVIGIEEVVAIGYGTQVRANLTGAVSSIGNEELIRRPSHSTAQLIQGRMSGLQIIQQSGEPGEEKLKINIRGQGTFSTAGSAPLVVVDGVSYPSWTNLDNLNPDNIESIDILKDAASASIYGARAANGVILVTTKRGTHETLNIGYHGSVGFQEATFVPDFINNSVEYMEMYNYAAERQGLANMFPQDIIEAYRNAAPNDPQYPNFDWRDATINPGWGQRHNVSASGGDSRTRFYANLGYYDQDAIVRGQSLTRYTAQVNLDTKLTDWLTFGTNINALYSDRLGPSMPGINLIMHIYDMNPLSSPRLPDGRWSVGSINENYYMTGNPWRMTDTGGDGGTRRLENHDVFASGYFDINLTPELLLNITGSYNFQNNFQKVHQGLPYDDEYFFLSGAYARPAYLQFPGVSDSWWRSTMPAMHATLNYTNTFAQSHNLTVLAGHSLELYKYNTLSASRRDFGFPHLTQLVAGDPAVQNLSGNAYEWAIQSFFGRISYNYEGKYLLEANARYDGTSRIHPDNRWGLFPSFSGGWRISEEDFLMSADWMDNLKIRASWGQLGNQNIGVYPYQSTMSTTTYALDGTIRQGVLSTALNDPTLKWEVTTITNVGLDLDLGHGLFSFVFDVYNKDTDGILNRATIPTSVGLTAPMINFGSMNNKGFEFMLGHRNNVNELNYSVNFNFSRNRNQITELITPTYGLRANQVGREFEAHYMIEQIGIFQSREEIENAPLHPNNPKPGDLRFKDQNGDGRIDADDRVFFSGRYPKFIYGGNIDLNWRSWDMSVFVQGVAGTRHYITRRGEWPFLRMAPPTTYWRDGWTPDNPSETVPSVYSWPYAPMWATPNSYSLKNTSYVRVKNLQIGYNLPTELTKRIGLKDLRIYASADNLWTFAPYTTSDPERDEDRYFGFQTEAGSYPNVRTFTFGIRVNL